MSNTITRRDFLQMSAMVGATLIAPQLRKIPNDGNQEISLGNAEGEGNIIKFFERGGSKKEGGINQTGIRTIEVDGKKIDVNIDTDQLKKMILLEAKLSDDPTLVDKAEKWLVMNDLQIDVYKYEYNPILLLAGGFFIAPEVNLGKAKIGIPDNQMISLYKQRLEGHKIDPDKEIDASIILPHEINHLLEYIKSPPVFVAKILARMAEVVVSTIVAQASGDELKRRDRGLGEVAFRKLLTFGEMSILFQMVNLLLGLDQHSHTTETDKLEEQIKTDLVFKDLVANTIKFSPKD